MSHSIFNNISKHGERSALKTSISLKFYIIYYLVIFALFILNILPTGYASFYEIHPGFLISAFFYSSLFIPAVLPIWAVFIIGILFDLIMSFPLGASAILFMGLTIIIKSQRRFLLGQNFASIWLAFIVLTFAFYTIEWGVISIFNWHLFNFIPVVVNTALTVLIFPFIVVLFHRLRRLLIKNK